MHRWAKGIVEWRVGKTLYLSVPFTWLLADAQVLAASHKGPVMAGGPAVNLVGAPWATATPKDCEYDVLSMHNACATFTTRGCPNRCPFCAVPRTEGDFRELNTWKRSPLICDNNLLASSRKHFARVIESIKDFPAVDFNQGLDARLFTSWHAEMIAKCKSAHVRFSLDHTNLIDTVGAAISTARKAGLRHLTVFALIGYQDTPQDAKARLDQIVQWKAMPCPMRFQPLDARKKNSYVAPGWTERELRKMMKYYWQYRLHKNTPYEEFRPVRAGLFGEVVEEA